MKGAVVGFESKKVIGLGKIECPSDFLLAVQWFGAI